MAGTVHMVCGPPGAGKTTRAHELAAAHRGVPFTLDDWLVTLYGGEMPVPFDMAWATPRIMRIDHQVWKIGRRLVGLGVDVILDLGFILRFQRDLVRARAAEAGAVARLHVVAADREVRRERVLRRNRERTGTFTIAVDDALFDAVDKLYEPPDADELAM